ncbi:MAG TPA: PepSY domain-containing protein, partial [Gammaproteobacteria bacterium]|nr:PepSY domain-containing protein [Gammaproteobacteria bacterium]
MPTFRRALILTHRYLGIPLSVLFVLWFVTGIAMIYVGGMPTLSAQTRLAHLPPLDLAAVRYTPAEAAERAASGFGRVALTTVLGRPAYRFASAYGSATVFADTGEPLDEIDVDTARGVAAEFVGAKVSDV